MITDSYESVVFFRDSDAEEVLGIMQEKGESAALNHLKKLHEPGEGTLIMKPGTPWKDSDTTFEEGEYIMYYDSDAPYIGLVVYISQ